MDGFLLTITKNLLEKSKVTCTGWDRALYVALSKHFQKGDNIVNIDVHEFHNWRTVPDVLLPLEHEAPGGAGGEALGPALGAHDVSPAALLHRAHRPQPRPALPAQPRLRVHPQQQCTQFMVL